MNVFSIQFLASPVNMEPTKGKEARGLYSSLFSVIECWVGISNPKHAEVCCAFRRIAARGHALSVGVRCRHPAWCKLLSDLKINYMVRDERELGAPLLVTFQGELRHHQKIAAEAMLAHDTGVLSATTAFGKTVVAAWLIAKRAVNTVVLVHRRQLQEQWIDRLSTFLGLPAREIGRIGGGRKKPTGIIDVVVIQSRSGKESLMTASKIMGM